MNAILIGCGLIAGTHVRALNVLGHRVTWVVGRDEERTGRFAQEYGIPNHTTVLSQALSSDAASAHICTPPSSHSELIKECFLAGKHVISEKPLTLSASEAQSLCMLQQKTGQIGAVCLNVRFYPANQEAARCVREGRIGKPLILSGSYLQEFHAPPHDDGWRFNPLESGDQRAISEIGTHWIDLAYAWTGKRVTAVSASLGNWYPVRYRADGKLSEDPTGEPVWVDTEDAAAIAFRFEDGGIGAFMLSELSRGHLNDLTIELNGSDGTLRWEEEKADLLTEYENGSLKTRNCGGSEREETFVRLFREVYADMEGKKHGPYPTFEDGLYLARVCAAIRKSGTSGMWVEV